MEAGAEIDSDNSVSRERGATACALSCNQYKLPYLEGNQIRSIFGLAGKIKKINRRDFFYEPLNVRSARLYTVIVCS